MKQLLGLYLQVCATTIPNRSTASWVRSCLLLSHSVGGVDEAGYRSAILTCRGGQTQEGGVERAVEIFTEMRVIGEIMPGRRTMGVYSSVVNGGEGGGREGGGDKEVEEKEKEKEKGGLVRRMKRMIQSKVRSGDFTTATTTTATTSHTAIWSRTSQCPNPTCRHVFLDDEIMSKFWSHALPSSTSSSPLTITCSRCDSPVTLPTPPTLAVASIHEENHHLQYQDESRPTQTTKVLEVEPENTTHYAYKSPMELRAKFEAIVRSTASPFTFEFLKANHPAVLYNLWWLTSRVGLDMPFVKGGGERREEEEEEEEEEEIVVCAWTLGDCVVGGGGASDSSASGSSAKRSAWNDPFCSSVLKSLISARPPSPPYSSSPSSSTFFGVMKMCCAFLDADSTGIYDDLDLYTALLYILSTQDFKLFEFKGTANVCEGEHVWCRNKNLSQFDEFFSSSLGDDGEGGFDRAHRVSCCFRAVFGFMI